MSRHELRGQRGIRSLWGRLPYGLQLGLLMVWWLSGTALAIWGADELFTPGVGRVTPFGVTLIVTGSALFATWFVATSTWQKRREWAVVCELPHVTDVPKCNRPHINEGETGE